MCNDVLNCCTVADDAHALMTRTANSGSPIVVPTNLDVQAAYAAATGWDRSKVLPDGSNPTDNGDTLDHAEAFMETTGLLGHKSVANGLVSASNVDHIKWGNLLFGTARLGLQITQGAIDQFDAGEDWDVGGDATLRGYHDVPLVYFEGDSLWVVTWGKEQRMTRAFFAANCFQGIVGVYPDFTNAQGLTPAGLDLPSLISDLQAVA